MATCPAGSYCGTGEKLPNYCPPGSYGSASATATDTCASCPIDYYCPEYGMQDPSGFGNTYKCPDGYLCLGSAIHPSNRDDVTIKFCPVGFFCTQALG